VGKLKIIALVYISMMLLISTTWASTLNEGFAAFKAKNYEQALQLLQPEANKGVATAQGVLARMYVNGWGVAKDPGTAIKWARLAAAQGDPAGQSVLGFIYSRGRGVEKDYFEAVKWYRLSADQSDAGAQGQLGFMYRNGYGVDKNLVESLKWFKAAAAQNDAYAQGQLGYIYQKGIGISVDYAEAVKWYRLSADQSDAGAQGQLGFMYRNGHGVDKNLVESLKWFKAAAAQNDAYAQGQLGYMYQMGIGMPVDYAEALRFYRLAADRGDVIAQGSLGLIYRNGIIVEKNLVESLKWFKAAAAQNDAYSQGNLGHLYQEGIGVPVDYAEALKWYRLSADQNNPVAQSSLGIMYEKGYGVPKELNEARRWYSLAAAQGNDSAKKNLSRLDESARIAAEKATERKHKADSTQFGLTNSPQSAELNEYEAFEKFKIYYEAMKKSDTVGAIELAINLFDKFQKYAENGSIRGQYAIGRMYDEGIGTEKNIELATYWYRKASEQGSSDSQIRLSFKLNNQNTQESFFWLTSSANQGWGIAQFALGMKYYGGMGVPKNTRLAYFWLLLAASDGSKNAIDIRDNVGSELASEQRIQIQTEARNWRPKASAPIKYSATQERNAGIQSESSEVDSTGSGFRVARDQIVTNNHVIEGCHRLQVNGVVAQLKSSDPRSDLALLDVNLPGPSTSLRSQRVAVGELLAVGGYPLRGLLSGFNMTIGNISSLSGMGGDTRLVQITAPVQLGNSGGPVLDSAGNLIGVVVSKLNAFKAAKITGDIAQNVNFAINVNVLRSFLDANSVEYTTSSSSKPIASTAIAEKAKGFTVLVECWK